jgi:hypothetical protein
MKNLKRIFFLVLLVFIASKVLFSDLDISKSENKTVMVVNK